MRMTAFLKVAEGVAMLNRTLARWELFLCQFLIIGFSGLLLTNVVLRYGFSAPLYYAQETAIYILIWMSFLAIAATIARKEMISLTFAVDLLPTRLRLVVDIVVQLAIIAIMLILLRVSWVWLNSPAVQFERALTLGQPKRYFYAVVPIFCALASFHSFANLLELSARLVRGAGPPTPGTTVEKVPR